MEDITPLLISKEGTPDFDALRTLQNEYRDGSFYKRRLGKRIRVLMWHPQRWGGPEVDLVDAVQQAQQRIALPDSVFGDEAVLRMPVRQLVGSQLQLKLFESALKKDLERIDSSD